MKILMFFFYDGSLKMYVNSCDKMKVGFTFHENNLIYRKSALEQLAPMSLSYITRTITRVTMTRTRTAVIAVDCRPAVITHCETFYIQPKGQRSKMVLKVLKMSRCFYPHFFFYIAKSEIESFSPEAHPPHSIVCPSL